MALRAGRLLILLALSVLFMLFLSPHTSPLSVSNGMDSSIFRVMGTALANGQEMYVDIWDHKGPVHFVIQWIAQLGGASRFGVFVAQILFLFGTLVCFYRFASWFLEPLMRWVAMGVALVVYSATTDGGNFTEEYSLFFSVLVLLLLTREWAPGESSAFHWGRLAVSGAAFALVVFIRLNNALPIFAMFVAYFLVRLVRRQKFWAPFLIAVAGFCLVSGAIIAGFAIRGSLGEMFQAAFLHNIMYTAVSNARFIDMLGSMYSVLGAFMLLMALGGGVAHWYRYRDQRFLILAVTMVLGTAAAIFMNANGYRHYLQLGLPAAMLGTVLGLACVRSQLRVVTAAALLVIAVPVVGLDVNRARKLSVADAKSGFSDDTRDVLAQIPSAERSEVFVWHVHPEYFLFAGESPVHRYFFLHEDLGVPDPTIPDESIGFVEEVEPTWVLTDAQRPPSNERLIEILDAQYGVHHRNDSLVLYERTAR